jgi:hypothetical protein
VGINTRNSLRWARNGAIAGAILSLLTFVLPPELGGYNDWMDPHLFVHNLVAVVTRIIVFATAGAALSGFWYHNRQRSR